MAAWRQCKLGEILEIKHGFAFLGEHFADAGTHIVLTPGNFFDNGGFKHKGDKEKWYRGPIPSDYVLDEGDLIVAMTCLAAEPLFLVPGFTSTTSDLA